MLITRTLFRTRRVDAASRMVRAVTARARELKRKRWMWLRITALMMPLCLSAVISEAHAEDRSQSPTHAAPTQTRKPGPFPFKLPNDPAIRSLCQQKIEVCWMEGNRIFCEDWGTGGDSFPELTDACLLLLLEP